MINVTRRQQKNCWNVQKEKTRELTEFSREETSEMGENINPCQKDRKTNFSVAKESRSETTGARKKEKK